MQALDSLRGMLDKPPAPESAGEPDGPPGLDAIPVLTDVVEPGGAPAADDADEYLAALQGALEARIDEALAAASRSMSEELKRQLQTELQALIQLRLGETGHSRR